MDAFSISLQYSEINFLRQSLETVNIQGKDAKFCTNLQLKLEKELEEIANLLKAEEIKKEEGLKAITNPTLTKTRSKKS